MKKIYTSFFAVLLLLGICAAMFQPQPAAAQDKPLAYVLKIEGIIGPATYDLIHRHLQRAADEHASIVILEMHTPGGLYDSMQSIIQDILDSPVPVATYVSPAGSRAASAGTYILYASHIAAMAPGTDIGAATPIRMGEDEKLSDKSDATMPAKDAQPQTHLEQKMVNDAAAYIRGLAELRGRNAEWAEKAVRDADSLNTSEALSKKVIDVTAEDIPQLLNKIDGRTVRMAHGTPLVLHTKGAEIENVKPDWRTDLLTVITHPNVAFLLMTLGSVGLIYEIAHPGVWIPGVAGAICLLLGLYALNILPISYAGLGLIFLGIGLMATEAFIPAYGMIGIGGAISFVIGAVLLIRSDVPGFGIDWWMIGAMALSCLAFLSFFLTLALKAQRKPRANGIDELKAATGEIVSWHNGRGEVRVTGELWHAEALSRDYILQKGDKVKIVDVHGLRLIVTPQNI